MNTTKLWSVEKTIVETTTTLVQGDTMDDVLSAVARGETTYDDPEIETIEKQIIVNLANPNVEKNS